MANKNQIQLNAHYKPLLDLLQNKHGICPSMLEMDEIIDTVELVSASLKELVQMPVKKSAE
jgi:hypothetical protein